MKCHLSSGSSRHNLSRLHMETLQHNSYLSQRPSMLSSILLWQEYINLACDITWNVFSLFFFFFCMRAREQQRVVDMPDAEGKHYSEFTHSLAIPAGLQAAPWSSPMGFSIIHQCLHYSLYLLAPGKCSLSQDVRSQYSTNTQLVDTGKVLSPKCCLWGDMHLVW